MAAYQIKALAFKKQSNWNLNLTVMSLRPSPDRAWFSFGSCFLCDLDSGGLDLSVTRINASLVSKGRDERKMSWLCSLPKHKLWDTNQGMFFKKNKE